jgi:hypothetical protein
MLEFSELGLSDIDKLRPLIVQGDSRICNNTVGGVFMWRDYFTMEYSLFDDTVIFKAKAKYNGVDTVFSLPLGKNFREGINKVTEYCRNKNLPVAFYAVTEEDFEPLRSMLGEFKLHTNENWSDYIYEAAALVGLEGRKYSGKRNHINRFKKDYSNYSFEEINEGNLPQVRDFYTELTSESVFSTKTAIEDHNKTMEVLDNYSVYSLLGGLIRVNGSVVAFSIGEVKNDVLYIHTEKADMRYNGVYQVINNDFARHYVSEGILYINREEDDGDLGLRFSKNSYHPCKITSKYILVVI